MKGQRKKSPTRRDHYKLEYDRVWNLLLRVSKMTQEPSNNELPIEDAFAELLSAYHDGELSAEERAEVEERLADDPAAGQWLRELQTMGNLCQQAGANGSWKDLSSEVLAEATRRREEAKPQVAPRQG